MASSIPEEPEKVKIAKWISFSPVSIPKMPHAALAPYSVDRAAVFLNRPEACSHGVVLIDLATRDISLVDRDRGRQ
jgi:hypothetical protein